MIFFFYYKLFYTAQSLFNFQTVIISLRKRVLFNYLKKMFKFKSLNICNFNFLNNTLPVKKTTILKLLVHEQYFVNNDIKLTLPCSLILSESTEVSLSNCLYSLESLLTSFPLPANTKNNTYQSCTCISITRIQIWIRSFFFHFNQFCIMHRITKSCGVISTPPPTLPTENSKLFNSQTAVKNCQNYHQESDPCPLTPCKQNLPSDIASGSTIYVKLKGTSFT